MRSQYLERNYQKQFSTLLQESRLINKIPGEVITPKQKYYSEWNYTEESIKVMIYLMYINAITSLLSQNNLEHCHTN